MKQFLLKLSVAFLLALIIISQQVEAKSKNIIWSKKSKINYQGFTIIKKFLGKEDFDNNCQVKILKNKKVLASFDAQKDYWVNYGFFNFLGGKDKQLIIHTYSGGAHCCYDYAIFDLKPKLRKIYDSNKFDSGSEIGNELVPVDIDKDGVYEFEQDVMAFDYFYESHSSSIFPPSIFKYNKKSKKYYLANNKFSKYVLKEMQKSIDGLDAWAIENNKAGGITTEQDLIDSKNSIKFLYLIYAGKKDEAWKHYDDFLYLDTKDYIDKDFKETYRRKIKELFVKDPAYLSIYGK